MQAVPAYSTASFVQVSLRYNSVPYHNFWHCVDVAHTAFLCLSKTRHRTAATLQESLALLIAAVCHDLEHPGASASPLTHSLLIMQRSAWLWQH